MDPTAATEIPDAGARAVGSSWVASPASLRALSLERAARLSLRLGDQAARRVRRKSAPIAPDLACGLYRQSAYYSLCALQLLSAQAGEVTPPAFEGGNDFAAAFRAAPSAVLVSAAGGAEQMAELEQQLCDRTFVEFSLTEPSEAIALGLRLQSFTRALLTAVEVRQRGLERKSASRSFLFLALAVFAAAALSTLLLVSEQWDARRDLALGKPWRASSRYYTGGCDSPEQDCPGRDTYFVHTEQENEPWLEIDLKTSQKIAGAHVTNRTDCCLERVVPLVLEVSLDQKRWSEVARMTQSLPEWKPTFAPVPARWVRLRVAKYSTLHLRKVRIFP